MATIRNELGPCGVFCGACPSFGKTCKGCSSEDREQGRSSKWSCKIRNCCYDTEKVSFCIECGKYPCKIYRKKLLEPHRGEPAYRYRHEIPENFEMMKELGPDGYLEQQERRWSCPHCGGRVQFYYYKCRSCGKAVKMDGIPQVIQADGPGSDVTGPGTLKQYGGRVPACGCFCGGCPVFVRDRKPCPGAAYTDRCEGCKTFHLCCKEKGVTHCHQCPEYPCKKFKAFAKRWLKYGQNFLDNQEQLKSAGEDEFLRWWNSKIENTSP